MSGAILYESVARIARHEAAARAIAGAGIVTDVFAGDDHAVTVRMRDTGLVLPRVPVAVGVMGYGAIPSTGDLVAVIFLEGDYNAPVVVGRLYHSDRLPPDGADASIVLRLPSGDDNPALNAVINGAEPSIKIALGQDVKVEITSDTVNLAVAEVHVNVTTAGGGRAEVAAGGSTIVLSKDGDITISAAGNLKLEGNQIEISGSGKVKISGAEVELN